MKKIIISAIFILACGSSFAAAFKSPSFNGSTGLISTPTAFTGWEDSQFGIDFACRYLKQNDGDGRDKSYLPAVSVSLFRKLEVGGAYDLQEERGTDWLSHAKFNFYNSGSSALAIGGNYQKIEFADESKATYYQLYLAATYGGSFFGMPAETTLVFGKTDGDEPADENNFDFSMGFDLDLFPSLFKGYVHWINDFANYSYSYDPIGANSFDRGCLNTGARIAVFKDNRHMKLNIDAIITDVLDEANRDLSLGAAFGFAF